VWLSNSNHQSCSLSSLALWLSTRANYLLIGVWRLKFLYSAARTRGVQRLGAE